ncbi:MFS transporter [Cytobacillus massiliigabonensis]|uniref:MFS transporter n=1 Tax=Cytobacillus massiliigabonensis TaxID=1871011 RepID=UPI000C8269F8|nr:MFS transporter [Cytobacillus massiliigabonensis]
MNELAQESTSAYPKRWLALFILLLGTFMVILDTFIVNVAIPTIQEQMHTSAAEIQLIVASYVLSYAVLLITGARIGDKYGRKRMFIVGMVIFIIASDLCGMALNTNLLIFSRVIQGIGAAILIPQVLSIIQVIFPPEEKGKAIGFYGAISGLGLIAGQMIGGLLIDWNIWGLGWRNVFLINIPIGLIAVILIRSMIPEIRTDQNSRVDWKGILFLTISLLLLVFPLIAGREAGWPLWIYVSFIGSLLSFFLFLFHERKVIQAGQTALIPLSIFSDRSFSLGVFTILAYQIGNSGFFLTVSLTLQDGLALSAIDSAIAFTPIGGAFFLSCLLAPKWVKKMKGTVLNWGAIILIAGYAFVILCIHSFEMTIAWQHFIIPFFLIGFGQGLIGAPLMGIILAGSKSQHAGSASGILSTFMQIANVLGVAVIGTIFFSVLEKKNHNIASHIPYLDSFNIALYSSIVLAMITFILIFLLNKRTAGKS